MSSSRINPNDNAGNSSSNNNNDYDDVAANETLTVEDIMELWNDAYRRLAPFRNHPECLTEGELRRMGTMELRAMTEEFEVGLFDEDQVRRNAFACHEEESERDHRGLFKQVDRRRRHKNFTSTYRRSHKGWHV